MNKILKSVLSVFLVATMAFSIAGCGDKPSGHTCESKCPICSKCLDASCTEDACKDKCPGHTGGGDKEYVNNPETRPVIFSIGALDGNFNPFFATSGNDTEIIGMTQIGLLTSSASGEPICGEDEPTVASAYTKIQYDATGNETTSETNTKFTEYSFLIKNNLAFSDGKPLTVKDVLFNLYVYLDPMYMGSSTIYSTDIVGLKAYQAQDASLSDDVDVDYTSSSYATATAQILAMVNYLTEPNEYQKPSNYDKIKTMTEKLFMEELQSDWAGNFGGLEGYKEEYSFTADWQSYYLNEGLIEVKREQTANGSYEKVTDENGKFVTTLDDEDNLLTEEMNDYVNARLSTTMTEKGLTEAEAIEYLQKECAINTVYENYTFTNAKFAEVLMYWQTASNVREQLAAEARAEELKQIIGTGELKVKSIKGITTEKVTQFNGKQLSEEHDVLKIKINGIDPKAIWNFGFSVAPMHYYSSPEEANAANGVDRFGVKFGDYDFFEDVLKNTDKNGLPVGAGVYQATDKNGGEPVRSTFYENKVVYFKRNENFYKLFGNDTSKNAKIKYLNYKEIGDDKIISALLNGEIDYGEPNATPENIEEIKADHLSNKPYLTSGYGYVGINPKFVPDLEVRQAIMHAMDTSSIIKNYYGEGLADVIYRPMSSTSWAYPKGCTEYYPFTTDHDVITSLVESADWKKGSDGIYQKDGKKLKITFTIAGETEDHPAFDMFKSAEKFLEECGFDITVKTDINALKSLATGGLEVWAAAWSSALDPDMYQIYHKDSTATSVKNWNYAEILTDTTGKFSREAYIVGELSRVIEEARETNNQDTRIAKYSEALDLVMELAVELPTYQRNDLSVYNHNIIDSSSLNPNPDYVEGLINKLWELDYV
ncbi:MAG: hypothetical protein J6B04_00565 [Clostridia bacterium]|nr:hypothetical protein [Clostridia bacterium]